MTINQRVYSSLILSCLALLSVQQNSAEPFSARLKAFGSDALLPPHDLQRTLDHSPAYDGNLDLRLMWHPTAGAWNLIVDYDLSYVTGDSFAFRNAPQSTLDQSPSDDRRRLLDLSWRISDTEDAALIHRFDRLAASWHSAHWNLTLGRQAVSWGSGIVFQPMDLFNPFAPTTVDRDYKAGDDLVLIERLFDSGSDLQVLGVFRRDERGNVDADVNSLGLKWHLFAGESEVEFLAGRHYADRVYGFSVRHPLGGALLRTDWVVTDLDRGSWEVSGVLNLDYSFEWFTRSWYVFGELYRNGFGVDDKPADALSLPQPLLDRLIRGEVFNSMRYYSAVGAQVQWHPLWTQTLTLMTNLNDHSNLVQTQVRYEPGDHQRLEVGLIATLGDAGEEFGGVYVTPPGPQRLTTGGGTRFYLRYAYYW